MEENEKYKIEYDGNIRIVRCVLCNSIVLKDYGNTVSPVNCSHLIWVTWGNYCFSCGGETERCPIDANPEICKKYMREKLLVCGTGTTYYTLHYTLHIKR